MREPQPSSTERRAAGTSARYLDPSLPIDARVADLLARMTLDEKLAQLGSIWSFELLDGGRLDPATARSRLMDGIGQVSRVAGATNLRCREAAAAGNAIQRFLIEETRLGIPAVLHEECLHGVMAMDATCFPQAIGQASTWEPALIERMARLIARRLRSMGASQGLAPVLDVSRDPRWGRIEETFGEDPYLVAELGAAYVRGVQDGVPGERRVVATGKHMVGHGVPEGGFNQAPAHIGPRELHDVFLYPFQAAVRSAGLGSMMHAYDDLDGVPCVASRELFTAVLREGWGFDGMVVSDYAGISKLVSQHKLVAHPSDAAAMALHAGVDVELPVTAEYGAPLRVAIEDGRVDLEFIDRAVTRVITTKMRLGLFEEPYVDPTRAEMPSDEDRAVALEIAQKSIVLLRNEGILPLRSDIGTIAVIGPNADSARNLVGDYGHVVHIETLREARGRGGVAGTAGPTDLPLTDELAGWPTILSAIRGTVAGSTEVRFARGCGLLDGGESEMVDAVEAASGAEVAVLVLGERSGLTEDCTCGEARDRVDLGLPGRQAELFARVAATGTPIVLVLVAGRPLAIPREAVQSAAVLAAWVPGECGPAAIADVLFGRVSPSGRLPVTVPRHVGQVPVFYSHKPSGGRSHWRDDYVDGSHEPLWPFGFGLSYSDFRISDLRLGAHAVPTDGEIVATVTVTNVGGREADEVVQLYARDEHASVTRPVKELRGFARVRLLPGEAADVTFRVAAEQLAFTDVDGRLVVEPGTIRVMVGRSSVDLPCQAELELVGGRRSVANRTHFFSGVSVGVPTGGNAHAVR